MSFREYVSLVVKVNVSQEPCVILGRQAAKFEPGYLKPPGGGVEVTDENLMTAAIREFHEETGIRLSDLVLSNATDVKKLYARCHDDCIVHVFGLKATIRYTAKEMLDLIAARHANADCPDELTEIVAVPVYDLYNTPSVRRDVGPSFRKELSCCEPSIALENFLTF